LGVYLLWKSFINLFIPLWTNNYFVTTVGGALLEVIKQYIENQQTNEREKEKKKWNDYLKRLIQNKKIKKNR